MTQPTWSTLINTTQTLLQAFNAAVDAYNGPPRDWNYLQTILDDNVILKLPDDTKSPIVGKHLVLKFLKDDADTDNPHFNPAPDGSPIVPHDVDNIFGFFTGVGFWKDNNGKGLIHYDFIFLNKGDINNPDWKLLLLWGSKD